MNTAAQGVQAHPFVLRQKLEDFSAWFFPVVDRFPKREKWALCTQIKNCLYRLVRRTIQVQKSKDKVAHIFEVDIDLEMLRYLIRQAHGSRYLSNQKLKHASSLVAEIGKILGGMLRKCGVKP